MTEPETEIDTVSDSDGSKEQSPIYSQKETDIESISSDKVRLYNSKSILAILCNNLLF